MKMISAIITAAGSCKRYGCKNKMLAKINGQTILEQVVGQFDQVKQIKEILVTYKKGNKKIYKKILKRFGQKIKLVEGGEERINSAFNALKKAKGEFIIIHDGARPFIPTSLIEKLIEEVKKHQAAMTAVKPTATIKYSTGDFIEKSFPRVQTWIAQTPQAFKKEIIFKAYQEALKKNDTTPTDDSDLVFKIGKKIKILEGRDFNIKITYAHELAIAKKLYQFIKEKL